MAANRRKGLAKGLGALLGPNATKGGALPPAKKAGEKPRATPAATTEPVAPARPGGPRLEHLPLAVIEANPFQPRQEFDDEALAELRDSIKESGLIQPLIVRKSEGKYQLIAGERRLRACKLNNLTEVPCIVTEATDEKSLVMALVENLQREDLNAIDEAEAYAQLRDDFSLSQEKIAERVGKTRVAVANTLRLLNLPAEIQEDVRDGIISAGHARALLSVTDPAKQRKLWEQIKKDNLTVREIEQQSRGSGVKQTTQTSAFTGRSPVRGSANPDPQLRALEDEMMNRLGCRVQIKSNGASKGRVEIHYGDLDQFERILETMGLPVTERL